MKNNCFLSNIIIPVILAVFFSTITFAGGTGKIAGKVTDAKTGEILPGANVVISAVWQNGKEIPLKNLVGAASDINGQYYILNLNPGSYSVVASYIGYDKSKVTNVLVNADQTTRVDFKLESTSYQTQQVVVTGYRTPKVEKDRTATVQIYDLPEMGTMAGINDISDILNLQADYIDNHFRGGRQGEANYVLGGSSINNPLSHKRAFAPITTGLQQVQVLTSGFNAEYGNAQSGIVNMIPREGGEKWTAQAGYSMDLPHYQTWGGDPYSTSYMPFWNKLTNSKEWLGTQDPSQNTTDAMFASFEKQMLDLLPNGTGTHADSVRLAEFALKDYETLIRDIGLQYSIPVESRLDISTGGPISKSFSIFTAARQTTQAPIVPTPQSNYERQLMSNLTARLDNYNKFVFSFTYDDQFQNNVDNVATWFDRIFEVPKETITSKLMSLTYNHVFNQSSFIDVNLSMLNILDKTNPEFLDPDRYRINMDNNGIIDGVTLGFAGSNGVKNIPSGQQIGNVDLDRGIVQTNTYSGRVSFTSQVNEGNMIKTGLSFSSYELQNHSQTNAKSPAEVYTTDYTAYPFEGALYVQDKMEFEGMIANFGLREDFYDFNTSYFQDIFAPRKGAPMEKTKLFAHLSPRLGISFPITETTVFHLNYGSFVQRPEFDEIFNTQWESNVTFNTLGNPNLKPEITDAYDIGLVEGLPFDLTLGLSAYYKNVQNLVHEAYYVSNSQAIYQTYDNLDYANIRGFYISLEKSGKIFNFFINYNYQVGTGKASSPSSDQSIYIYQNPELQKQLQPQDIVLDFNRTHRIITNFRINLPHNFGFSIFKAKPLADVSLSTTFTLQTGQPYTYDVNHLGLINNMTMPTEFDLKARIQKGFKISGVRYTVYLEGFNLLNLKVLDNSVFDPLNELNLLQRYKAGQRGQLIWYDPNFYGTTSDYEYRYQTSNEQQIYDNIPRYFRIGLMVNI